MNYHYVFDYIHEFLALADANSYSDASEDLYISQSTLSKHIIKMEQELGEPLFDRSTREVRLSEFGKNFLPYAESLYHAKSNTAAFINIYKSRVRKQINISAIPLIDIYGLPQLISNFKLQNPDCAVNIIESYEKSPLDNLKDNSCELAFLRVKESETAGFQRIHYTDDSIVAVLSVNHRCARMHRIPLSYLKNDDFFLIKENTSMYDFCVNACRKAGFEPNIVYTSHRIESICAMVAREMGVTLLMRRQAEIQKQPTLSIVDLDPEIQTQVAFYYSSANKLSEAASRFVHYLENRQQEISASRDDTN